jgi:hypothetical protein
MEGVKMWPRLQAADFIDIGLQKLTFMVCILLCIYLYSSYLSVSLHNFYNDKINITVSKVIN